MGMNVFISLRRKKAAENETKEAEEKMQQVLQKGRKSMGILSPLCKDELMSAIPQWVRGLNMSLDMLDTFSSSSEE